MMDGFEGQTALVTGGSRGMGLDIARELLKRGARVAITGRKNDALKRAKETLEAGDRLLCMRSNASDLDEAPQVVGATIEAHGSLDLLVNNVGISPYFGPLMGAPASAVMKTFEVNVVAALAMAQESWTAWMKEHGGAIVNVSSVGAKRTAANLGVYALTKAALSHLTMQLSSELAPAVRVNGVAPATVKTDFSKARYEGHEADLIARYPMARLGTPQDVSSVVCFLLSEEAGWITGEVLNIDGGALKVDTA